MASAKCSDSHDDACVTKVAEENVRHAMQEIRAGSAYVAAALDAGKIRLVGAMCDVGTGKVTFVEH